MGKKKQRQPVVDYRDLVFAIDQFAINRPVAYKEPKTIVQRFRRYYCGNQRMVDDYGEEDDILYKEISSLKKKIYKTQTKEELFNLLQHIAYAFMKYNNTIGEKTSEMKKMWVGDAQHVFWLFYRKVNEYKDKEFIFVPCKEKKKRTYNTRPKKEKEIVNDNV